ncbi:hypothetical protein BSIN_3958 [Burkholderia singularis]|uniref:Uncharacterized protein n=1 Tax=Burkholderia singularis TaxID=1503053 RepID=A0A238H6U5_9BURK|nr:hypothetical protein BSIN_3958 [Burkholderia singularis]
MPDFIRRADQRLAIGNVGRTAAALLSFAPMAFARFPIARSLSIVSFLF